MSEANFLDILDQETPDVVKRPPPMPVGTYQWIISGPHRDDRTPKGTPVIEFPVVCHGAMQDVDDSALEEFQETAGPINGKQNRLSFYVTADAVWRLDAFFREVLQLPPMPRRQALAEAVNQSFAAKIKHAPSNDGSTIYANIDTNSLAAV